MDISSPIEDVKYCFGTFHDRPLATFKDDESYTWNRPLVHECRTCEHLTPCFFISTQVKMSKDESLPNRKNRQQGADKSPNSGGHHEGGNHCPPHGSGPHSERGHHRHKHHGPPRKDGLDLLSDFVQMLKDSRG